MLKFPSNKGFAKKVIQRKGRFNFIYFILIVALLVIVSRLYMLTTSAKFFTKTVAQSDKAVSRKNIVDRHGRILATNVTTYSLYVKSAEVEDRDEFIEFFITNFPDIDKERLVKKVSKRKKNLVLLKRDITNLQKLQIEQEGLLGVYFLEDVKRVYPHTNLFSHLIGYVDMDEDGLTGFERYNNDLLFESEKEQIQLSLDLDVQSIVREELDKAIKRFSAKGGVGVVMDVDNGEVIAMVSLPDYDPYEPWITLSDRSYNNRATLDLYEMGSTFKIITMAAAIEHNILDDGELFDVSQPLRIDNFAITDYKKAKEGLTSDQVFIKSSNIGTARIALRLEDHLIKLFKELAFYEPLKVEIVERAYSREPRRWSKSRKITSSYGYGISVTTIHLMQAIAAVVNGGNFHYATFIKGKDNGSKKIKISERASKETNELMRKTVYKGTGWRSNSRFYKLGGKTGTAHKIGKYGYDTTRLLSSFVATLPYENPRYLIYVNLDEPQGIEETGYYATGGVTAAPVVKNIVERTGQFLGIYPER